MLYYKSDEYKSNFNPGYLYAFNSNPSKFEPLKYFLHMAAHMSVDGKI
jgi:hypothetical protein